MSVKLTMEVVVTSAITQGDPTFANVKSDTVWERTPKHAKVR